MDIHTWNVLSLCSGVGGLDLGVRLAVPSARTVCYVEREAFAVAVLVARMQDKCLDEAPVWTDVKTFDGRPWDGKVDCIIGGYPCQPFSIAGSMRGADDERHLWPNILRIIRETKPDWCFFENVENHVRIGFENVRQDLLDSGFDVEAGIFTAAEVGASHGRSRLFILAHAKSIQRKRIEREGKIAEQSKIQIGNSGGNVVNSDNAGLEGRSSDGSECAYQLPSWPPGPQDTDNWREILEHDKTIEPAIYRMVDGMDTRLDSSIYAYRQERLRAVGNGVVPLTAAFAFQVLLRKFL